jgi:hypothetical protein
MPITAEYDAGIELTNNAVGAAQITQTTLDGIAVNFDSAVILDPNTQERLDDDIGLYAPAYDYNGATIISYRGTDDFDSPADLLTSKDVEFCWPLGIGNHHVAQGIMALEFYNAVADDPADTKAPGVPWTCSRINPSLPANSTFHCTTWRRRHGDPRRHRSGVAARGRLPPRLIGGVRRPK